MHARLVAAMLLLVPAASATPIAEPSEWMVWADDAEDALPLGGGDIATVRLATTGEAMHLAMAGYPSLGPSLPGTSEATFDVVQEGRVSVRFAWHLAPELWIQDAPVTEGWQVSGSSGPLGWHVEIAWAALGVDASKRMMMEGLHVATSRGATLDTATGPDLALMPSASGAMEAIVAGIAAGATIEGPDYGGGTSITVDDHGEPWLAYYIYGTRGDAQGIYIARIDTSRMAFSAERVADTSITQDHGRDGQMRTQIAHDGSRLYVLFTDDPAVDNDEDGPGHPGTPDSVFVLVHGGDGWAREDPTPGGTSDVGPEDVADLAARDGRVVAAVPVGDEVWVVERTGAGKWEVLSRLADANNAKLALDSQGDVHVAYVVYPESAMRDGKLYYASSADGYAPEHIGDHVDAGWEEPETDGSFAIAVGPEDEVAILWNDGAARDRDKEQPFVLGGSGAWARGYAPLVPVHGNPQYTMRLGFAQDGRLVAASGYGGSDSLAVMTDTGAWAKQTLPRYDVWDMAIGPTGIIYFAYTQPHGGTTVALSAYGEPSELVAGGMHADAVVEHVPGFGTAMVLAALAGLAILPGTRRRQ